MLVQCRTIFLLVIRVAILSQPRRAGVGSTFLEKATWELVNLTTFYHWLGVPVGKNPEIYWLEDSQRIVGSKILEPLQSLQGFAEHRLGEGTLYCKKVCWETSTLFDKLSKRSDVKLFICQEQESLYTSLHQLKPIGSMYGIFTYIYHKNQPNVGVYTIHGSYGKRLFNNFFRNKRRSLTPKKGRHVHLQKKTEKFPTNFNDVSRSRWLPDFPLPIPTCFFHLKNMSPLCIFSWPCPTSSFSSPFHHRYPVAPNSQVIEN